MAAPTPVSALLHSATMVTAGIFLCFRLWFVMHVSTICSIGCFTSLFGGIMAVFQSHMKRIIAYSTTSQLGYMMFSCGLTNYFGATFHLFVHAFFKSFLFLTAGFIIHSMINESHILKLAGSVIPLSSNFILIGSLSLIG
jgi:NADH-ubiquinone oxidoreductase chain 5